MIRTAKLFTTVSCVLVAFGCGGARSGYTSTTIVFDNQSAENLVQVVQATGSNEKVYFVAAGTRQRMLHAGKETTGTSSYDRFVRIVIENQDGLRRGYFSGTDRYDDASGDTYQQFPDGKSGLGFLAVTCTAEQCELNGKALAKTP